MPGGWIDKYIKGRIVAQGGSSQVRGVHDTELFTSSARVAAVRIVITIATEDLELHNIPTI